MAFFGANTDHFGILALTKTGGGTLADVLELVNSTKKSVEMTHEVANDENDDPAAQEVYGNLAGELFEASSEFVVKGTLALADVLIGELATGKLAVKAEISTKSGEWPKLKVDGKLGTEAIVAPTGKLNKWKMPAMSVLAAKRAQPLGFTVSQGRLVASSLSVDLQDAQQADGLGEPIAHGISGGIGKIAADFVMVDADEPAWTVTLSGAEETMAPSQDEPQAKFNTTSAAAAFIVAREDAP